MAIKQVGNIWSIGRIERFVNMRIIIYGAGSSAQRAYKYIGYGRVICFAVTNLGNKNELFYKRIISYEEMIRMYKASDQIWIVVASDNYYIEMEKKLEVDGVTRYFTFHDSDVYRISEVLPWIDIYGWRLRRTYTETLFHYNLRSYRNIAIYGKNEFIKYLIMEIIVQAPDSTLYIVSDSDEGNFLGCKYIGKDELPDMDCIILNVKHKDDNIRNELSESEQEKVLDLYDPEACEPLFLHPELQKYKDIHKGRRCFIVATGPSLRIEDLDKLHAHGEICISVNKIYRCYDKTSWRADYVGISDPKILADVIKDKKREMEFPTKLFVADNCNHMQLNEFLDDCEYFHKKIEQYEPNRPRFSSDMSKYSYWGNTVTYDFALQMAAYMGFSEIYLIGVDHSMTSKISDKQNHFIDNYYTEDEQDESHYNPGNWDASTKAYEAAEEYSRRHGFRIYNATRGGVLEVFERVNFDELF